MDFIFILQAILLGLGLAMDASCVSAVNGLEEPKMKKKKLIFMALLFGLAQGIMPTIGYFIGSIFKEFEIVTYIVPFFALIVLGYLGIKMICEAVKKNKELKNKEIDKTSTPLKVVLYKQIFLQAFATSLDALSVGFVYIEYPYYSALTCFAIVALITFGMSLLFVWIGKKFGTILENKASIVGGAILVAIGLKIFIEFLIKSF